MRAAIGVVLHQVVVADAAGDDAQALVRAVREAVEGRGDRVLLELGVVLDELLVADPGVHGKRAPLTLVRRQAERVLRDGLGVIDTGDDRAGMGQAGGQAHQHRNAAALGIIEGAAHHLVRFLLGGRFEDGNQGERAPETGVLLVLRTVHGRVVAGGDDQAAVRAGGGGAHERVRADVHAHMLHAHEGPLAGEGHAEGFFHRRLFIDRPGTVHAPFLRERVPLDEFGDFGGGGPGISIDAAQACVQGTQRQGFVSQEEFLLSHNSIRGFRMKGFGPFSLCGYVKISHL